MKTETTNSTIPNHTNQGSNQEHNVERNAAEVNMSDIAEQRGVSKAQIVREYLREEEKKRLESTVDYALSLGFKTRAAAKSCVVANMKKLGLKH